MRICLLLSLLITSSCLCIPGVARAQHHFPLSDPTKTYRLDQHVQVLLDTTHQLTIDDVTHPNLERLFAANKENLTFGYLKATIWLKIDTRCASPGTQWYLDIPAPFLEYVDFYQQVGSDSWDHTVSGYLRKHSERSLSHTGHVLRLHYGADSLNTSYVRIGGVSPKTFTVIALEKENFVQKVRYQDLEYGLLFGILLVMLVYNLYLWMTLRKRTYALYVLIIALTSLIFATISGYGGKFLWPEVPIFNYIFGKFALEALVPCISLYTIFFLEVRKFSKVMYYLLVSLIPLSAVALVLSVTQILSAAGNHLITLSTVVFIASGFVVRIHGNKNGTYFIAAWAFYFLGGLALTLRNSGVFDYNFWTTHVVEIGAILGVTLMGFGLGAQYRRLQKEKEEAQQLAYRMQQEDTVRLEAKVQERTHQLYESNHELQQTLETNRMQTSLIEHKNAELDSFFHRVSHDLKGPVLSSLGLMALARLDIKDKVALEYIDKQTVQLERLSQIINGLMNLTRVSNDDLRKEKIDFVRMVDECIASFNHTPNFEKVRFEKEIADVQFFCEWTLVNAILQNLIENSIKYVRGDTPYVRIRVYNEGESLILEVQDNGPGIPEEHQDKIFDMFYRATADAEGSGLGLYIIKRSVDRLKGTIQINSAVGVGSTFSVRLPLRAHSEAV